MKDVRLYGYTRKRDLPAAEGTAKVCTRCDLWFVAGPRERACQGCLTPSERARRAARVVVSKALVGAQNSQVRDALRAYGLTDIVRLHARATAEGRQGCGADCKWCGYAKVLGV